MNAYRGLLRLLPRSFRDDHAAELESTFRRRLLLARGRSEAAGLWARELGGLLAAAVRIHAELLVQDLRWSRRSLGRAPGFALAVAIVAALGVGATTATFSVTDHVLVRPLPFASPERLVKLWKDDARNGYSRVEASPAELRDWRERSASFESLASYWPVPVTLVGEGEPERLLAAAVSAELDEVLRLQPAAGRLFEAEDDLPGAPATAVLSHELWRARFAADRGVIGRELLLDGEPTVVVGVLPAGSTFPDRDTRLWKPQRFDPSWFEDRDNNFLRGIGRLRPGVSLDAARAELAGIAAALAAEHPRPQGATGIGVLRLRDELSRESRLLLWALVAAASCLLLLACANLAGLLLARSLGRARELAVRAALGGGRARLVRQMLTESLLLAGAGGAAGTLLALGATPILARLVPSALPIAESPPVDLRLLGVALLVTLATGLGFGLAPALRAPVDAALSELRDGPRSGRGRQRSRRTVVALEVALSVALVASCGLLLRTLSRLQAVDPGFRPAGVVTLRTWLPRPEYDATEKRHLLYSQVLEEARALPGVTAAGYTSFLPMTMRGGIWQASPAGADPDEGGTAVSLRFVTPGLLEALGVPLLRGRLPADSDTAETESVAVVSESFAERLFPGEETLGRRIELAFSPRTVVGIVGDVAVRGLGRSSEPQVYLPHRQVPDGALSFYDPKDLAVRAAGPIEPLVAELRRIVARADPNLPVTDVRRLEEIVGSDTAPRATQLAVLGAFAAVALLLTGIGLHGLLAYTVASRRRELGVRMALGATRGGVAAIVLRHGLVPAAAGLAAGLALAAAAAKSLSALLYAVSPFDATTYVGSAAAVLAIVALGSALPALRAVRIDPTTALRAE